MINPTILMSNGEYFDFTRPEDAVYGIEEVAHALSNLCRFTGHCLRFYSVAQHSVLVSRIVPPDLALQGLLHDAAEAFIGDVAKPLKLMLPDYMHIEKRIEAAVFTRFGLPAELHPQIKVADKIALRTEQRDLMYMHDANEWKYTAGVEAHPETVEPMSPDQAYALFMGRYKEIVVW